MTEAEDDWRLDFVTYIMEQHVPEDKVEREKSVRCNANYVVISTELYRRSASNDMLMKCILGSGGLQLLQEIHGGGCATTQPLQILWKKPSCRASTGPPP
jgi:hypothetical protein